MPHTPNHRISPEEPRKTGALLVMFRDGGENARSLSMIEAQIGRKPICSSEYRGRAPELSVALRREGAVFFEQFGISVLDPSRCGATAEAIDALSAHDDVALVRPEYEVYASGWLCRWLFGARGDAKAATQGESRIPPVSASAAVGTDFTWGLRAINAQASPFTGAGVKICVLDTGIAAGHPDFAGRAITAVSFVDGETTEDGLGHGTHVAGVATGPTAPSGAPRYGVAPGVELFVGKVLGDNGSGREGDILAGVLWGLEQGCEIISMSLGRRAAPGDASSDYERVGRVALDQGSLVIAAAGNESVRSIGLVSPVGAPANAPSIMAVGAVDRDLSVASFSNGASESPGGELNITGPGVDILSATPPGGHGEFSGTSMATPHVSGVAALLAESNPALRGRELWAAIEGAAKDIGQIEGDVGKGLAQAPGAGAT